MLSHHHFKHVREAAVLGGCAALPEVSNLGGHFQRCRFSFSFGSCHGEGCSVFFLYFKQIYVIEREDRSRGLKAWG